RRVLGGRSAYDFSSLDARTIRTFANSYEAIVRDTHGFLTAKGIPYVSVLQPVRWYDPKPSAAHHRGAGGIPELAALYHAFDEFASSTPFARSLTGLFEGQLDVYVDACHVDARGKRTFVEALTRIVKDHVERGRGRAAATTGGPSPALATARETP